jgi:probable DNA repair protein
MNGRLRECLDGGFTVVTASARLARRLQFRHAHECIRRGRRAWETPDILHFDAWLERCWRERAAADPARRVLLSRAQAEHLWLEVIAESRFRSRLLQPAAVAREAARAWDTLQQWCAPPFPDDLHLNEDARAFAIWMRAFRERCAAGGWLDPASLGGELRKELEGRGQGQPGHVGFVGFDAPPPVLQALIAALRAAGCAAELVAGEMRAARPAVSGFGDRREEIRSAASWIRARLETGDPPSIGIVLPDLPARRRMIEEIFEDMLDPGALRLECNAGNRAWSIAQGTPLSGQPIVAAALAALSLGRRRLPFESAAGLLRSPFLMQSADEATDLARLDALLRRRGDARFDLQSLLQAADALGRDHGAAPPIAARLRRLGAARDALPRSQTTRGWAASFSRLLTASGWPGWRPLDSGEYQSAEAWREALDEFAALELFGGRMGFDAALSTLARMITAKHFQPRTGEAPVEVLGMEGAADMGFDCLWVMGLEEGIWPPAARPSPFLPMRMQRELAMPLAAPEIALRHARGLTQRLAACADEVIFSYPRNEAETPLRMSPLLRHAGGDAAAPRPAPVGDYARQVFAARAAEEFTDETAAAIATGWLAPGGAALLRDQAACPFRAFARHRLAARPVDPVDIGLDARDRGSLVHAVLESIWTRLRDQRALLDLDEAALNALIADAVDAAVEPLRRRRPGTITPRFAEVEKARLAALLRDWLLLERRRAPFSVEACEQSREVRIGGLRLKLRVDRVDALAGGGKLILDYKTGDARIGNWFGDRPDEPQLPLYTVTAGAPVSALAFARVKPGRHAFIGAAASPDLFPELDVVEDLGRQAGVSGWDGLIESWRRSLEALAAAFLAGGARVDPKNARSCRECDLHAFCRINESQPWLEDADD